MARKRERQPARAMKRVFLVFCEGETEEGYLNMLRREYRSPIKIVPKVVGGDISQRLINAKTKEQRISPNESIVTFLMYDMDKAETVERLKACKAETLLSNPCVELWFLLHAQNQNAEITTSKCIETLRKASDAWRNYEKPLLTEAQKTFLFENKDKAIARAQTLTDGSNPSSSVYRLLLAIAKSGGRL